MSIVHNLSNITDNLSGYDMVSGESDGTTIGKSYLIWQFVQGLIAFDSNFTIITSSSPTPSFLQAEVGTVTSAPAKNAAGTMNQAAIRLYRADDPGLSQTPQSAIIYEINTTSDVGGNNNLFALALRFKISGGTTYAPTTLGVLTANDNNVGSSLNCIISLGFATSTTTTMSNIPKLIFIKTSDSTLVMAIKKSDGSCMGYGYIINPSSLTSYKHNVGVCTEGLHLRSTIFINALGGASGIEGVTQTFAGQLTAGTPSGITLLTSSGQLPANQFTYSGNNYYMSNKLRVGLNDGSLFKSISGEIEGVLLLNSSVAGNAGSIISLNSVYYLFGTTLSDGRDTYKILFRLSA